MRLRPTSKLGYLSFMIEAARLVTGLTKSVPLDCLNKEVGWVPLSQRRK